MSFWDIQAFTGHWVWWTLTVACVVWYSTITVYVAIRGVFDIRGMLRRLAGNSDAPHDPAAPSAE